MLSKTKLSAYFKPLGILPTRFGFGSKSTKLVNVAGLGVKVTKS